MLLHRIHEFKLQEEDGNLSAYGTCKLTLPWSSTTRERIRCCMSDLLRQHNVSRRVGILRETSIGWSSRARENSDAHRYCGLDHVHELGLR